MVSHRQKRLWRFVEENRLLKLQSYLRKHRDLELNFHRGSRQWGPLHLACDLGHDALLRVLLQHGASVLQKDHKGDTALHVAANRALEHGWAAHDDLVVPLKNFCPEAMDVPNNAGVTPADLLKWIRQTRVPAPPMCPPEQDLQKQWMEKLFDECEDEFFESFGVYDADDFLPVDEDEEDFGDWADRIRREYFDKKHAEAQRLAASSSGWKRRKQEAEQGEKREELHQEYLRREAQKREELHKEYLRREAQKREETGRGRKRQYDERCAAAFHSGSSSCTANAQLSYSDIPWPAPHGSVQEMVDVMLHGADPKDASAFRKVVLKQQVLWHPDKFAQRCEARLEEKDKRRILDTVTALSQELNRRVQGLKT